MNQTRQTSEGLKLLLARLLQCYVRVAWEPFFLAEEESFTGNTDFDEIWSVLALQVYHAALTSLVTPLKMIQESLCGDLQNGDGSFKVGRI